MFYIMTLLLKERLSYPVIEAENRIFMFPLFSQNKIVFCSTNNTLRWSVTLALLLVWKLGELRTAALESVIMASVCYPSKASLIEAVYKYCPV